MGFPTKIATCCYCGTRAALVLNRDRHELACSNCGAPLHNLKRLPTETNPGKEHDRGDVTGNAFGPRKRKPKRNSKPRRKYKKRRKGLMHHLVEEAFDVIEDIFD